MRKETLYGKDARDKILSGVKKIVDAVKVTLGPLGRNILISESVYSENYVTLSLPVKVTKDGYHTARAFDLQDPFEKAGVLMVKEAAQMTVNQCGDGTTTTCILLEAIVTEGMKMIEAGANPIQLKREIDAAVVHVVSELKKMAVQIGDDNDKILNIATISANNDPEIGQIISDAFTQIGKEGIIDIERGNSVNTEIKIAEGYRFDQSWVSPLFINRKEKQICEYEKPFILLYEKMITHHTQVQKSLEIVMAQGRPIVIICEDGREEGLAFLVMNNFQRRIECCVVKAPSYGEGRRLEMEDIALLTGGTYISDSKGIEIKEIEKENLGQAEKVIITKEETIIIGGLSDKKALKKHIENLKMDLAQAKNEDEAYPIEKRIAKLQGGVAVIQVGGPTETEMKEKLDRFDDAVRATKSAIAEGYVPGGGTVFLNIKSKNKLIDKILLSPFVQICLNAGVEYEPIMKEIIDHGHLDILQNKGYNAKTGKVEDLVLSGVIDPAKVLRCSIQNAASAAGMILTSEVLIVDTP